GPVAPGGPAAPVAPVAPVAPAGPAGPVAPAGPAGPWGPTGPGGPVATVPGSEIGGSGQSKMGPGGGRTVQSSIPGMGGIGATGGTVQRLGLKTGSSAIASLRAAQ